MFTLRSTCIITITFNHNYNYCYNYTGKAYDNNYLGTFFYITVTTFQHYYNDYKCTVCCMKEKLTSCSYISYWLSITCIIMYGVIFIAHVISNKCNKLGVGAVMLHKVQLTTYSVDKSQYI